MVKDMIENKNKALTEKIAKIASAMFERKLFNIFNGSISAKLNENKFIINTNQAMFSHFNQDSLIILSHTKDYTWQDASIEVYIHSYIYKEISEARCILHTISPHTIAQSLKMETITLKDYYGATYKDISVYDPKEYSSWFERADVEICNALKVNDFVIVKGYGLYAYGRNLTELSKKVSMIENSIEVLSKM